MFRHDLCPFRLSAFIALLFCLSGCASSGLRTGESNPPPLDVQLNEQVIRVPIDPVSSVSLQATVFKPNGLGPFPLAVLNHGKEIGDPHYEPRYRSAYIARYFVSRGYEVVMPMLRGFAGSDGEFVAMGCDAGNEGLKQAEDLRGVVEYMKKQPDIDPARIVISGQSYGGWNTLALGTLNIPGVRGLLNFAGGRHVPPEICPSMQYDLYTGAGHYGATSHVPSIWFYGNNDDTFPVETWRLMYRKYTAAGGRAELVAYGTFMKDSHNFLGTVEALPIWIPKVDAFLARIGLPNRNLHPELMPVPYPAPTHFAAVDDVSKVPYLDDTGRQKYRDFLDEEMPRVFIIAPDGSSVVSYAGYDPLGRALELCRKAGRACQPYAIDDKVVWAPGLLASH